MLLNIFTAVTYRNILYGRVIVMHVETAGSLSDMRRSRKFSRGGGGGSPSEINQNGSIMAQIPSFGTQDLTILINLSPQILGLLGLYFPLSREKKDGWAGNCFGSVRSSFVTLLSARCAFSQGSNLGFHVARLY